MFAGIGGFRYGFEKANTITQPQKGGPKEGGNWSADIGGTQLYGGLHPTFTFVWANDNDKYACQIYRKRFGDKENGQHLPKWRGSRASGIKRGNKPNSKTGETRRQGGNTDSSGYWHKSSRLYEGDIRAVDASAVPEHDFLTAGFPCQSFSIAGQGGGFADTRGTLFFEICRIAGAKRTPYLLLENVRNLLSVPYTKSIQEWIATDFDETTGEPTAKALKKHKAVPGTKGWVFLTILDSLWQLGYGIQWCVLNSKNYGVPQNRERVYLVGHLRGQPRPKVFPLGETSSEDDRKELQYLGAIMSEENRKWLEDGKELSRNFPQGQRVYSTEGIASSICGDAGGLGGKTGLYMVRKQGDLDKRRTYLSQECPALSANPASDNLPLIYDVFNRRYRTNQDLAGALKGEGISETSLGTAIVAQALQTDGQLRQGVSWGTDKPQSARNIRRLTPTECARLQGFPDDWARWGLTQDGELVEISDTQQYKCYGNAATTKVTEAIGRQLLKELCGHGH